MTIKLHLMCLDRKPELGSDLFSESLAASEEINLEIDDIFNNIVFEDAEINFEDYFFESSSGRSSHIYEYMSDFNEDEFNLLMENLADADFNS